MKKLIVLLTLFIGTQVHAAKTFEEALHDLKARYALKDEHKHLRDQQAIERKALRARQKAERDALKAKHQVTVQQ